MNYNAKKKFPFNTAMLVAMFDFDAEKSRVAVVVVIPLYNANNEFNLCNSAVSVFIFAVVGAVVMYSASVHVYNSW